LISICARRTSEGDPRGFPTAAPLGIVGSSLNIEGIVSIADLSTRRPALAVVRVALAIAVFVPAAAAQVVRGTVVDEASLRPVPGVVVVLLDSAGNRLTGVLADEDGRYAIRAAGPGRYGLRVEQIGFRAAVPSPVTLRAGEAVELRLVTRPVPVALGAVQVAASTPCVARATDGREVSDVWEEARKALYATDLAQRQELFNARVNRYVRTLDARTRRVIGYEAKEAAGVTRNPFVSESAARLSANGFVRQNESETIYFAPDAAVLLSDEFLNDHCFRLRSGTDRRSGLIGLEFEPVRGRDKADIAGTLWIDRASAELRDLEYSYRRLANLPTTVKSEDFGGRIEFQRMPTGAWIVERWIIRMPVVVDRGPNLQSTDAVIPGLSGPATERARLAAIREEGGEVLETTVSGSRRELAADRATMRGMVFDSTRMAPLADARVFLDGTQFSTQSSADGAFVLENVPPGTYGVAVMHPRFDSLGIRPPAETATLKVGETATLTLAGPSAATIIARDCPADERGPGAAALRGRVHDAGGGGPVIDAEVVVSWKGRPGPNARGAVVAERTLRTRTDSSGRYGVCGLPDRVELSVRAVHDRRGSVPTRVLLPEGEVSILDLPIEATTVAASDAQPADAPRAKAAPTGRGGSTNPTMQAVERRRSRGGGTYLTRTQIERANASRFTDLLRAIPGVSLRLNEAGIPVVEVRRTARLPRDATGGGGGSGTISNPTRTVDDRCPAEIRVDDLPMANNGVNIDGGIQVRNVEVVEVYSGSQVPVEFAARRSMCGLVLVWTRAFAEHQDSNSR